MFAFLFIATVILLVCIAIALHVHDLTHKNKHGVDNDEPEQTIEKMTTDASPVRSFAISPQAVAAEDAVEYALRQLEENRYFVFRDLIIPSSAKNINLTQIDHVLVSRKGIFCIETKSSNGNIYGRSRSEDWKQYVGNSGKPYSLYSPFRQNYHHVKSLEMLLRGKLRAPVHSYIAFPNAKKVVVDGVVEDMSVIGVVAKIQKHQKDVYDYASVEHIAKVLAHAGSLREQLRGQHIDDVTAFLEAKVAGGLKIS